MARFFICLSVLGFCLSGCLKNPQVEASLSATSAYQKTPPKIYALLPFDDRNAQADRDKFPDASRVVYDAFESAFISTGEQLVERSKLDAIIAEQGLSNSGFTESQGAELGKLLNADAVIIGAVTTYYRGAVIGRYTAVAFSVKAVDVESGAILWKGSVSRVERWDYDLDPAIASQDAAKRLSKEFNK